MTYRQHQLIAEILEPWIEALSGDEWGEFMFSLLQVYRDSDMLKEEEQDYLLKMLLEQFRAYDFEMIFDYQDVSLAQYKRMVGDTAQDIEKFADTPSYRVDRSHSDDAVEVRSLLPNWMVEVDESTLPEYVLRPNFPTAAKVRTVLGGLADDEDATAVIKAFYKGL